MITLLDFARRYVARASVCSMHGYILQRRASIYAAWAGTGSIKALLDEDRLGSFLAALGATRSPVTVESYRRQILTLWRAAAEEQLVRPPRTSRIRRVRVPDRVVLAYSVDEVRALLGVANPYWSALIRTAWDSGQRKGDLLSLERSAVRPDGSWRFVQHKTGKLHVAWLRPSTVERLDALGGEHPLRFDGCDSTFRRWWWRLKRAASVPRGQFRWLRRSAGSVVEAIEKGAGAALLGNTEEVFRQHYDAGFGDKPPVLPPEL